jgi:hypothetical protein
MVAANGVAGGLCFGVMKLAEMSGKGDVGEVAMASMFLIPLLSGLVAAWFWRRLDFGIGDFALHSIWTCLLGLGGAAVLFREGIVCLVMVSPLYYVLMFAGAAVGRLLFRPDWTKLQVSVLPLLALATVAEPFVRADERAVVTDEIRINAPPSKVWPNVLAFREITAPPRYWIFQLGLPAPMKTTNGGNFVGADRQCIFSDGIVIKERVAEFEPEMKLTFDVTEQPKHPEAYGHITLHRGQFVLRDNHDGTTTLTGSSWYTLHVRPRWYFELWTRDMTRAVHLRVMEHIRRLAETAA